MVTRVARSDRIARIETTAVVTYPRSTEGQPEVHNIFRHLPSEYFSRLAAVGAFALCAVGILSEDGLVTPASILWYLQVSLARWLNKGLVGINCLSPP